MNPWFPILNDLPLSKSEQEVVKRYEKDPEGRSFLPVADILRAYDLVDESIELLMDGVMNHPKFTVARVVLSRELYEKGLIKQAWDALDQVESSLAENILAQKLKFKLAILLGMEPLVRTLIRHIQNQNMNDQEVSLLIEEFDTYGLAKVKQILIHQFESKNVNIILPQINESKPDVFLAPKVDAADLEGEDDSTQANWVGGYKVMHLNEVFFGESDSVNEQMEFQNGIELDSVTLAEIYEQQGYITKALSVYRRLLRLNPNSDTLKFKIVGLVKKSKVQKQEDMQVDPSIVDSMEQVEIIDTQIRFYNSLLEKLPS